MRVEIDLTTTINQQLQPTTVVTGEVVIIAQRPIVTKDVSASQFNIQAESAEIMPVQTVTDMLVLQAGIQQGTDGISIRGGGTNETMVVVDGFVLNDERTNIPYMAMGLSATKEFQVQTGGFNAGTAMSGRASSTS